MPAAEEQQAVAEEGPADADASSSTSPTRKRARVVVAGGDGEDTAAASTGAGGAVKVLRDTLLEATRVAALRDQVGQSAPTAFLKIITDPATLTLPSHTLSSVPQRRGLPALRSAGRTGRPLFPKPARGDGRRALG